MTGWAIVRTLWQGALRGALIGAAVVSALALGTMLTGGPETAPLPVLVIQAVVFGGLLYGAPAGGALGALRAALRLSGRGRGLRSGAVLPGPGDRALPPARLPAPAWLRESLSGHDPQMSPTHSGAPTYGQPASPPVAPLAPLSAAPVRAATAAVSMQDPQRLNRVLEDLDRLPGLEKVAERVRGLARRLAMDEARKGQGLKTAEIGLHLVFTGPPGTGKTTVARQWGKVLAAVGLLPRGHVVEVGRHDLVAGTVGGTAPKTLAEIERARGGVLFIDEAYALASTGGVGPDFGPEAVATLLAEMENRRGQFAVIVAGYEAEMEDFLSSNQGLRSRFSATVAFEAFSGPALVAVARTMAADADYRWAEGALVVLGKAFTRLAAVPPPGWASARSVRSVLDAAVDAQAARLHGTGASREAMGVLTEGDALEALLGLHPALFGPGR